MMGSPTTKVSIKDRDAISVFMYDMKGLYSTALRWGDIMPVVVKIEKLKHHPIYKKYKFKVAISGNNCEITYARLAKGEPGYVSVTASSKLRAVVRAVVEFTRWHNSQSK